MKSVISTTYDDKYLYFLPICVWAWNKLGVDVICFAPEYVYFEKGQEGLDTSKRISLVEETLKNYNLKCEFHKFDAPEHKEATYAQCARLYGACLDLPEDEILVIGDVDMIPFEELKEGIDVTVEKWEGMVNIWGVDLVPESQFPMCYAWGSVKEWRRAIGNEKSYQENLDILLGELESEHFRGNHWSKDQEELKIMVSKIGKVEHNRARPNTQFASNRVDRDDINWRSYVDKNLVDAHLWRNGYEEQNFANILELLTMKYPNEDFTWLINYTNQYKALL